MEQDPNVIPETENQEGEQAPETPVGGAAPNPYEEQLKKIEAEKAEVEKRLKEREEQLALKDKALKKKQENVDPEAEERILSKVEAIIAKRDRDAAIKAITTDEAAQKLIEHHLENTIKPSGNLQKDLEAAWLLANQNNVQALLEQRATLDAHEDLVATTQMGIGFGSNSQVPSKSAARRYAEEILRLANPDAIKNLTIK